MGANGLIGILTWRELALLSRVVVGSFLASRILCQGSGSFGIILSELYAWQNPARFLSRGLVVVVLSDYTAGESAFG